jgi:hypothetical protein
MYDSGMNSKLDKAHDLLESARRAAADRDLPQAESLYQDAIAALVNNRSSLKLQIEAYIGLADCIDARGGNSDGLRKLAKIMEEYAR